MSPALKKSALFCVNLYLQWNRRLCQRRIYLNFFRSNVFIRMNCYILFLELLMMRFLEKYADASVCGGRIGGLSGVNCMRDGTIKSMPVISSAQYFNG